MAIDNAYLMNRNQAEVIQNTGVKIEYWGSSTCLIYY